MDRDQEEKEFNSFLQGILNQSTTLFNPITESDETFYYPTLDDNLVLPLYTENNENEIPNKRQKLETSVDHDENTEQLVKERLSTSFINVENQANIAKDDTNCSSQCIANTESDDIKTLTKSVQNSMESYYQELIDNNYFFKNICIIQELAKYLNFIFNSNNGMDINGNNTFSYKDICNQYDKSQKLVDEFGRVFFYIPVVSDLLIKDAYELREKYSDLIQMYRKWLSGLHSYEVKIENGKYVIISDLGNRVFIYGDKESIDKEQHKFKKDYKTSPDNFHVVMDKDKRVYFSEIPNGVCRELEAKRIINLCHINMKNINLQQSLFFLDIESIINNNTLYVDTNIDTDISKYTPKFLYCKNTGLPLSIHKFIQNHESILRDIKFNTKKDSFKETLLFLDQEKFDKMASEINLLSQQKILDQIESCDYKSHRQFHYDYVELPQYQLQNNDPLYKIWNAYLSDKLYLQTNITKNLLFALDQRKQNYIEAITQKRDHLLKTLDCYFNIAFAYCKPEEVIEYEYFTKNAPKNDEEKQKANAVFSKIEKILQNTKLNDIEHLSTYYSELLTKTGDFTVIGQEYKLSQILKNNPEINLLELISYSMLSYVIGVLHYEFCDSEKYIALELEREKNFLAKEIKNLNISIETIGLSSDIGSNPSYLLFSQDMIKLIRYSNYFYQDNIQELRKYKYIVSRLYATHKSYNKAQETLLNKEISKKINDLIQLYIDKIKKLEQAISIHELQNKIGNITSQSKCVEKQISQNIVQLEILKELEQFTNIQQEINSTEIFDKSKKDRIKEYRDCLGFGKPKNTLLIYNHASEIDEKTSSQRSCKALDESLMQPGYSYCYNRSLENFNNTDLKLKLEHAIRNNMNIHIVGVNDGTADAQYMLGFIANFLNARHYSGTDYNGKIFVELYNPVGIAEKLSREIDKSLKLLKLKNKVIINIINEITNKSIAVGNCLGIDFGKSIISDKSLFLIKNKFLNDFDNYLGYKLPHYCKVNQTENDSYYFQLRYGTWEKFKQNIWGITNQIIPTVHCMKRLAGLKKASMIDHSIFEELHNDMLQDRDLYKKLSEPNIGNHYKFNDIKDYLMCSPFLLEKIKSLDCDRLTIELNKAYNNAIIDQVDNVYL